MRITNGKLSGFKGMCKEWNLCANFCLCKFCLLRPKGKQSEARDGFKKLPGPSKQQKEKREQKGEKAPSKREKVFANPQGKEGQQRQGGAATGVQLSLDKSDDISELGLSHSASASEGDEPSDNDLNILADAAMLRLGLLENNSSQQVSVKTLSSFVQVFRGGKIGKFYDNWSKLTSDPIILSIVKHGVVINTLESIPNSSPFSIGYAEGEKESIAKEVKTLLKQRYYQEIPSDFR